MTDTATTDKPKTDQTPRPEPEAKLPSLRVGGGLAAIIPQDFDQAYRMARVIAASGTAPKSYMMKDPTDLKEYLSVERIAVAIMAGLEVGLPPMQAVQGIAVINGMPTVYGDARDGLIAASGLLEDMKEEMELDDQGLFLWARCTIWRKGRKTPISQTITRPQAARAGWLKKQGPWTESPNRMAQMRAKGWASRDAFPDVLKGLMDHDEAVDVGGMVDVTDRGSATTAPAAPRRADFAAPPAAQDVQSEDAQPDEPETEGWPLHDETGETVGRFNAVEWARKFTDAFDKLHGPECAQLLENNRDTAKAIWEDDATDEQTAKTISASYAPLDEVETVKNWKSDALGEGPKMADIKKMIAEKAGTVSEVDDIMSQNAEFLAKLSAFKRDDINKAAAARKMALSSLPA